MNEKAKKVLSYVACALGGASLGIALLGGLSYCATSSAREKADTINTIDRVRHNEQITTTEGGYTGYKMEFPTHPQTMVVNRAITHVYSINTTTWNATGIYLDGMVNLGTSSYWYDTSVYNWNTFVNVVNTRYQQARSSQENEIRLIRVSVSSANNNPEGDTANVFMDYWSFVARSQTTAPINFVLYSPAWTSYAGLKLNESAYTFGRRPNPNPIILSYAKTNFYLIDESNPLPPDGKMYLQDAPSYYKETGYQEGHTEGYSEGYDDAYAEKESGIAFTSCGVYPNAHVTLATDETIGNFKYMYLCHYITKPGYDEHTIYILWTTNANTGQYLGEVIDRNDSDSYDPAVTLGSFTQQATSSVTITANQDMEFGLWVGYITTFHNRGEITNSILWFQGGTSETDLQIYQNGYDEGYQNGNQQGQATGYENGYTQGKQAGEAGGYERGYNDGFAQTNTQNVFSLFTSAFGAVSSFFDLKIFGFLPLYWFFLAPLFIALISLLMRMVRH